jgi:hypothetical protein
MLFFIIIITISLLLLSSQLFTLINGIYIGIELGIVFVFKV